MNEKMILSLSGRFMGIYDAWAKNRMSKERAKEMARFASEQMEQLGIDLDRLKIDNYILVDLGIVAPGRSQTMSNFSKELIASYTLSGVPIVEGNKRWNMLGLDLEINPEDYVTEWQSPITDQEKTPDKHSNAYTFLAFCCGKNVDEFNRRWEMVSQSK